MGSASIAKFLKQQQVINIFTCEVCPAVFTYKMKTTKFCIFVCMFVMVASALDQRTPTNQKNQDHFVYCMESCKKVKGVNGRNWFEKCLKLCKPFKAFNQKSDESDKRKSDIQSPEEEAQMWDAHPDLSGLTTKACNRNTDCQMRNAEGKKACCSAHGNCGFGLQWCGVQRQDKDIDESPEEVGEKDIQSPEEEAQMWEVHPDLSGLSTKKCKRNSD